MACSRSFLLDQAHLFENRWTFCTFSYARSPTGRVYIHIYINPHPSVSPSRPFSSYPKVQPGNTTTQLRYQYIQLTLPPRRNTPSRREPAVATATTSSRACHETCVQKRTDRPKVAEASEWCQVAQGCCDDRETQAVMLGSRLADDGARCTVCLDAKDQDVVQRSGTLVAESRGWGDRVAGLRVLDT
jgi:hypothetical protein